METWNLEIFIIMIISIFFILNVVLSHDLKGNIPDEWFDYKKKSDILPENGYFLDTHSHTIASDGYMTAEQCIKWHVANGFDAFVLTDHNTGKNNEPIMDLQEKYPEILIIPGYEWTTMKIHLNFLGIDDFEGRISMNPKDEKIRLAIKQAKEMGAVVQVDHITWTINQRGHKNERYKHPTRTQLLDWGVDGFEVNNETRWFDGKTIHFIENLKKNNQLPRPIFLSSGTDVHNPMKEWVTGWTEVLLTKEERKKPDWNIIKRALLEGRTKVWMDQDYYEPFELKQLKLYRKLKRKKKEKKKEI